MQGYEDDNSKKRYGQKHTDDGWQKQMTIGCYAQRRSEKDLSGEHIAIKSGIGYPIQLGYAIYDASYGLGTNLIDRSSR